MPETDTGATLTREALERDHAALFAQLRSEFSAAGAAAERDRIRAVREQSRPGHEALVERLAADGNTTGPEAAAAVLAAERGARNAAAQAHANDAPNAAPAAHAPVASEDKTGDQKVAEAKAYAVAHKIDFIAAVKALGHAT